MEEKTTSTDTEAGTATEGGTATPGGTRGAGSSPAPRRLRAHLVDDAGARLGEGPAWDAAHDRLVWVDILAGRVHLADGNGHPLARHEVGVHVGAALPAAGGGWLLATQAGFGHLAEGGAYRELLDVHGGRPEMRFNDAKCDPRGRAIAGSMRYDETAGDGVLYRLDAGPVAVPLLAGRGLCNGLGWRPDGRLLYFIDSLARTVAAHPYDPATGTVGVGRDLVAFSPPVLPDGLCVDDGGGIWVALYGGAAVHRYLPDGRLDTVVEVPVPNPTSVAFGGPAMDRLFITSGGGGEDGAPAGAGGLWAVEPGITGPPATPWRPPAESARP